MPATYEPIATNTTTGTSTTVVSFTSIPQTYTDLVLIINAANHASAGNVLITFNSDTASNYSRTQISGNGTSATSARVSNATSYASMNLVVSTTNFCVSRMNFMNYSNTTTNKTIIERVDLASDSAQSQVGLWRSTAAISTVTCTFTQALAAGCVITLYGIKAA